MHLSISISISRYIPLSIYLPPILFIYIFLSFKSSSLSVSFSRRPSVSLYFSPAFLSSDKPMPATAVYTVTHTHPNTHTHTHRHRHTQTHTNTRSEEQREISTKSGCRSTSVRAEVTSLTWEDGKTESAPLLPSPPPPLSNGTCVISLSSARALEVGQVGGVGSGSHRR